MSLYTMARVAKGSEAILHGDDSSTKKMNALKRVREDF